MLEDSGEVLHVLLDILAVHDNIIQVEHTKLEYVASVLPGSSYAGTWPERFTSQTT